jgi:hypothetical protein
MEIKRACFPVKVPKIQPTELNKLNFIKRLKPVAVTKGVMLVSHVVIYVQ